MPVSVMPVSIIPTPVVAPGSAVLASISSILVGHTSDKAASDGSAKDGARIAIGGKRASKHANPDPEGDGSLLFSSLCNAWGEKRQSQRDGKGGRSE